MPEIEIAIVPVTPFQQNCALVWDRVTHRGAVVDPGGEATKIAGEVERRGIIVESILLTHGHLDHAGGAAALKAMLPGEVPIIGPGVADRPLLEGIEEQARMFGVSGLATVTPDRWLADGERVEVAGVAFQVLHCPGHTPGHMVYFSPALRLALVGDVLFRGSIGRTDLPLGDHAALLRSIAEKLLPLGDDVAVLSGHGPATTIGEERRGNPFLVPGTR
jgi:glyoxylase-like metal-dependent hydrolase (beta-lactamase superfamily II)